MIATCPRCGGSFETRVFTRVYCSNRCRKAMENQRKMQRDGARRNEATERRPDALVVRHSPSAALLEGMAAVYLLGGDDRPSVFTGAMPEWNKPAGVSWLRDATGAWIMQRDAFSDFESWEAVEEWVPPKPKTAVEILNETLGQVKVAVVVPVEDEAPKSQLRPVDPELFSKLTPEQQAYQLQVEAEEREFLNE